jgi:hypothetical protein
MRTYVKLYITFCKLRCLSGQVYCGYDLTFLSCIFISILMNTTELVGSRLPLVRRHFLNRAFAESSPTTHSELWDALLLLTRGMCSSCFETQCR